MLACFGFDTVIGQLLGHGRVESIPPECLSNIDQSFVFHIFVIVMLQLELRYLNM